MNGVYDGLTVVELTDRRNQWAGKLLSDGGARVIQIEPTAGGPGRWCGPFVDDTVDPDRCLDYWWYNTGKQSVALDVGRPPAQDLLRRLLAGADVFLESTPPGTLRAYGLDHGSVSSNRALIYTSLTDFGQDGPWRDYRMNDAAHLALGGHMASTGYSDPTLTPIGGQGHQAWHMGCVFALHGITLALFDRMTTGEGQYIDVSIHDACSIGTESAVPEWLYNGATLYRQTGLHASARPRPDLELPTADGMYVIAANQTLGDRGWATPSGSPPEGEPRFSASTRGWSWRAISGSPPRRSMRWPPQGWSGERVSHAPERHPQRSAHPRFHVEDRRAVGAAAAHALWRRGHPRRARRALG